MIGAVDIGGSKIAVGMVTESGRLLARTECPTAPERGLSDGLARIVAMLRQTAAQAGQELQGIGIGCTGPVNPQAGTIDNADFLSGWEGANLAGELSNVFNVPVVLENDADAAALGEAAWGAGRGAHSLVYITVGTGIGGGLVFDGALYRGVNGAHPEIGHHVIDPTGPACSCGARGCWESLASGPAMVRWMSATIPASASPGKGYDAQSIFAAAERGEPHALAAVAREGFYLGLGLANVITLFAPEVIALGGGVMRSRHLFWDAVQATIRATCGLVPFEQVRLTPAALEPDAALVGAACAWLYRYRCDALRLAGPERCTS